jgi:hypothetical protein
MDFVVTPRARVRERLVWPPMTRRVADQRLGEQTSEFIERVIIQSDLQFQVFL